MNYESYLSVKTMAKLWNVSPRRITEYCVQGRILGAVKENGNNVDLDSEMVSQAMNTIYYEALEKQISSRLSMRNYVINN